MRGIKAKRIRKQIFHTHDNFIQAKADRKYFVCGDNKYAGPCVMVDGMLAVYKMAKKGYDTGRFQLQTLSPIELPRVRPVGMRVKKPKVIATPPEPNRIIMPELKTPADLVQMGV